MPDDRDGGGDESNVVYLPNVKNIEVFENTPKSRPAGRSEPQPAEGRRWRSAIILAALGFVGAMMVAMGAWDGVLALAAIAGVIVLGAALARKRGPGPQRELRRPRTRTREAPGDRRMELHVWCEFTTGKEPTMIEAVEIVLANLYEDEERQSWSG